MRTLENLPRHELIGLKVEVLMSENRPEEGIEGKIIDEGKSVLKIECEGEEKTVQKQGRVFKFHLPSGHKCKMDGEVLVGRPEERIKKKLKKW